jgi:anti-anti-sigma regulatory factor
VALIVQGYIVSEWAGVLEHECAELIRSGLDVVLDLSGVGFISRTGVEVLGRLSRAGAAITGCSPLIADVLEQEGIEVARTNGSEDGGSSHGNQGGAADS